MVTNLSQPITTPAIPITLRFMSNGDWREMTIAAKTKVSQVPQDYLGSRVGCSTTNYNDADIVVTGSEIYFEDLNK
jgi:hypothetical protein